MIDFHQHLTQIAQHSKSKTSWKIRYRGDYLRMSSGKESWNTKGYAKAALMLEFERLLHAHSRGANSLEEYTAMSWSQKWPITCNVSIEARLKAAKEELLKLVEFVELKEKEVQ
jgi:hypothetical protein